MLILILIFLMEGFCSCQFFLLINNLLLEGIRVWMVL